MRIGVTALLASADLSALVLLRPALGPLSAAVGRPRATVTEHGVDGAMLPVVEALVWLTAAWLAVGLAAGLLTRLPGVTGQVARVVAGRLLPRALLSLVSGSAGVGLLLAPAAAAAPGTHPPAPAWPVTSSSAPAWPVTNRTVPASPGSPAPTTRPTTTTPTTTTPRTTTPPAAPRTTTPPTTPRPAPPTAGRSPTRSGRPPHQPTAAQAATLTVRPGDSLWQIARARLGPQATPARIAAEWPRWFAANRTVIGADPNLIEPGQVLRAPAPPHPSDPSSDPSLETRP